MKKAVVIGISLVSVAVGVYCLYVRYMEDDLEKEAEMIIMENDQVDMEPQAEPDPGPGLDEEGIVIQSIITENKIVDIKPQADPNPGPGLDEDANVFEDEEVVIQPRQFTWQRMLLLMLFL